MTSRSLLLLLAAAVAASAERLDGGASSRGAVRGMCRRKRMPPAAFQVGEHIFELPVSEYAVGKPYLLQFKGKGDDYCAQMEVLKEQLRDELGLQIRTFEVWYDSENLELMQRLDRGRCGGVPFFYNKRTRRYICGATTYANLRAWALSEPCEPILPPPNLNADNERQQNKVQKFLSTVKAKAQEKLSQRGGGGEEESE